MFATKRKNGTILFSTILMTIMVSSCVAELFTALVELEELLETEAVLITNLEAYVEAQDDKLSYLRRRIKEYQKEHNEAAVDIATYVSNPINAFMLTKRLTSDWKMIEHVMENDVGSDFLENVTNHRGVLRFPTDEDLNGAAVALFRLQDTYNLETSSIARGELNGIQYSSEMTSHDCFEMGRQSYINKDYYHTMLWMNEAIRRLTNNDTSQTIDTSKADILEYLAFAIFKQGNVKSALEITDELLEIEPNHARAKGNKYYYEIELERKQKESTDRQLRGDDGSPDLDDKTVTPVVPGAVDSTERRLYEALCRNEIKQEPELLSKLQCKYINNNPFLKLAPLKVEEAHLNPYILIFHDVMYDNEIEFVKKLAKPRFRRATVQNHKTGELETANYRISKSAWLRDSEDRIIANIAKRVEDMTGLTTKTAEELQVVNYGIGGHYEPHFDFARPEEKNAFKSLGTGNRIATVLFYMSDVQQGGATVFPALRTALWPKKGTAAFWFNLYASGNGNYLTRHAACPVLAGSKWVSNKWLHERGQEFLRRCELEPDHPLE